MNVRLWIRVGLCLALVLFAAASLLAVASELGVLDRPEPSPEAGWALRSWEGKVALFSPPDAQEPQTVTDVYVRTLPPADRMALIRGVAAADREAAVRLLEDYGA